MLAKVLVREAALSYMFYVCESGNFNVMFHIKLKKQRRISSLSVRLQLPATMCLMFKAIDMHQYI